MTIRGVRPIALLFVIVLLTLTASTTAFAQTVENVRDDFSSISYSGNNGSLPWSTSWREAGEADGPLQGTSQVVNSARCGGGGGNCLRIGGDATVGTVDVWRRADLTGATSATVSFYYRRASQGPASGSIAVHVSGNGGATWATLTTISVGGSKKASSATFDIGSYAGTETVIRFRGYGGISGFVHFDSVNIQASIVPPPPTTTTTAPPPTTTTTAPPPTTTTTAPPPTTTTTVPPETTTSSPSTTDGSTPTTTPGTSTTETSTVDTSDDTVDVTSTSLRGQNPNSTTDEPAAGSAGHGESESDHVALSAESGPGDAVAGPALATVAMTSFADNALGIGLLLLVVVALVVIGVNRTKP